MLFAQKGGRRSPPNFTQVYRANRATRRRRWFLLFEVRRTSLHFRPGKVSEWIVKGQSSTKASERLHLRLSSSEPVCLRHHLCFPRLSLPFGCSETEQPPCSSKRSDTTTPAVQ